MRDYPTYYILAVFVASGVSFFDSLLARMFVRVMTVVIGLVAGLALSIGVLIALAYSPTWTEFTSGPDGLRMLGDGILILYFGICILTCIPLAPVRQVRALGLGLHFIVLPVGTFLTTFSPLSLPLDFRLSAFAHNLTLGIIYAMLWFRMLEKQTSYRSIATPVNI